MRLLFLLVLVSVLFIGVLKLLAFFIGEKVILQREELTPYECGFEHHSLSRVPFSLRYFFLTLIFLLFDLEIVLLIFLPYLVFSRFYLLRRLLVIAFIFILFLRLLYE